MIPASAVWLWLEVLEVLEVQSEVVPSRQLESFNTWQILALSLDSAHSPTLAASFVFHPRHLPYFTALSTILYSSIWFPTIRGFVVFFICRWPKLCGVHACCETLQQFIWRKNLVYSTRGILSQILLKWVKHKFVDSIVWIYCVVLLIFCVLSYLNVIIILGVEIYS